MKVAALTGPELTGALDDLARLRIEVFRDWPYLYDGDLEYERTYLEPYRQSPDAVVVGAWSDGMLVGAATGTPLADHAEDFAAAFAATDLDLTGIFYCAESVLRPAFRGQGVGHRFFDLREAHARERGYGRMAFCRVLRPADHPDRPADYRPLDPFWRARGYRPMPGVVARLPWKDLGDAQETEKPLEFWIRDL